MSRWIDKHSPYPVPETLDHLEEELVKRGFAVMARIDHSENATKVGMDLLPIRLLLFGKPSLGTRLMQADPTFGIELPSKILVWQDTSGNVWLRYQDLQAIAAEHGVLDKVRATIEEMVTTIDQAADAAVASSWTPSNRLPRQSQHW